MPRLTSRPLVEPLEGRRLCAAVGLKVATLVVTATGGVSNTITVGLSADGASVVVTDDWVAGQGKRAAAKSTSQSFPLSAGITLVKITGSNKADSITVDQTYGPFTIPVAVHAGAGNDTVTGGDEPDAIWGQGGNDVINGGGGDDALYGMSGKDTLIGGNGNDYLSGGAGKDSLEGDAGNDTIYDPFGPDTILGGAGSNTFSIHSLRRDVVNDYNDVKDQLHIIPVPGANSDSGVDVGAIIGDVLGFL